MRAFALFSAGLVRSAASLPVSVLVRSASRKGWVLCSFLSSCDFFLRSIHLCQAPYTSNFCQAGGDTLNQRRPTARRGRLLTLCRQTTRVQPAAPFPPPSFCGARACVCSRVLASHLFWTPAFTLWCIWAHQPGSQELFFHVPSTALALLFIARKICSAFPSLLGF